MNTKQPSKIKQILKFLAIISSMRLPRREAEFKTDYFIARCNLLFYLLAVPLLKSIILTMGLVSIYLIIVNSKQFSIDWIMTPLSIWFISFLFIFKSVIKFVQPIPTALNQIPDNINEHLETPPWFSLLLLIFFYKIDLAPKLPNFPLQYNEMIGFFSLFTLGILYFSKDTLSYIRLFNTKYSLLKLQLILPYNTPSLDIKKLVKKLNANNYSPNLLPNTVLDPRTRRQQAYPFIKKELFTFNFNLQDADTDIPNLNDFVNYHINIVKAYNELYSKINFKPLSQYFSREIYQAGSWKNKRECLKLFYKELNELGYFQGEQGSNNAYQFLFYNNLRDYLLSNWFVETFDDIPDWFREVFIELYQRDPHFFETIERQVGKDGLEQIKGYRALKLSIILPKSYKAFQDRKVNKV